MGENEQHRYITNVVDYHKNVTEMAKSRAVSIKKAQTQEEKSFPAYWFLLETLIPLQYFFAWIPSGKMKPPSPLARASNTSAFLPGTKY